MVSKFSIEMHSMLFCYKMVLIFIIFFNNL